MASGDEWHSLSEPRSVVYAARRDRLESTSADRRTDDECLTVLYCIHEAFLLLSDRNSIRTSHMSQTLSLPDLDTLDVAALH